MTQACVFIQVAEDICHLQSAAEMMRKLSPLLAFDAENFDRKPSGRGGDPIAI